MSDLIYTIAQIQIIIPIAIVTIHAVKDSSLSNNCITQSPIIVIELNTITVVIINPIILYIRSTDFFNLGVFQI
ncbi:hypothetical protein IKN40_07660 [bacterium]|nr:hypothetical protein [bacterium]